MNAADYWIMLPFGLLLGAMAVAPIFAPQWWLRHYAKVALGLADGNKQLRRLNRVAPGREFDDEAFGAGGGLIVAGG